MKVASSPFNLEHPEAYLAWRDHRLNNYPKHLEDLVVEIRDPGQLTDNEHKALLVHCSQANMAIYASTLAQPPTKEQIRLLGLKLGLTNLDHNPGADADAITALTVQNDAYHREYIPYTNRAIAWHTDGYYNTPQRQIHAVILHCAQPADIGGLNQLLDHTMLYIALRDANPEYIRALMHPDAMTIPANVVDGQEIRPASSGPVFRVCPDGSLHMRYTDRTRSIIWRKEPVTQEAVAYLKAWINNPGPWHFEAKLTAGQGLIANNILHTRSAFTDGAIPRLLYRARYYERIQGK